MAIQASSSKHSACYYSFCLKYPLPSVSTDGSIEPEALRTLVQFFRRMQRQYFNQPFGWDKAPKTSKINATSFRRMQSTFSIYRLIAPGIRYAHVPRVKTRGYHIYHPSRVLTFITTGIHFIRMIIII